MEGKEAFIIKVRRGYIVSLLKEIAKITGISLLVAAVEAMKLLVLPAHPFFVAAGLMEAKNIADKALDIFTVRDLLYKKQLIHLFEISIIIIAKGNNLYVRHYFLNFSLLFLNIIRG